MHRYQIGNDRYTGAGLEIVMEDNPDAIKELHEQLNVWGVMVTGSAITREDEFLSYDLEIKLPSKQLQQEITTYLAAHTAIRSVKLTDIH